MAVLTMMTYGSYVNFDAVENVLRYVMRIRKNESRQKELHSWGGLGVPVYAYPESVIKSFLSIQNAYGINYRKGRRIFHEVITIKDSEFARIRSDYRILHQIIYEFCMWEYYQYGFQVVYAIHCDTRKALHVHFVVNSINYLDGHKWHTNKNETRLREHRFNCLLERYQTPIIFEGTGERI